MSTGYCISTYLVKTQMYQRATSYLNARFSGVRNSWETDVILCILSTCSVDAFYLITRTLE
jgi:hypothetical protein